MDNTQENYDELDNMVSSLDILINELTDKYFKESLRDLKDEAEIQMALLQEDLKKEKYIEKCEMNRQYERGVL